MPDDQRRVTTQLASDCGPMAIRVVARLESVECPACEQALEGFVGDPRGASVAAGNPVTCEHCGTVFGVPDDVRVDFA
jgi:hypothetical protein